ncbi:MAG: hypothetical protein ABS85_04515 [Sphingobacteriales bacterium SCN 48-20]|uniref:DUF2335 domain-containing protein n=1 Tax=Terrimonas ferruginea TaxID=249 RepID=UPI00086E8ACA|nr:DUF2335 domain-containing protein [Terrimonas ferruginea]MBN8781791.1 DUF2335 domain-containing protein [Terrimonas ferruginea]ODT93935.1 MAG: hypothetical protein ABS85_04515 [Sphingobacteriales bacterium SCN 48-20]OJW44938.1 MAG: hypothetical protein BGO56_15950 [Sphingobacteriales bacterium 48-107]
MEKEKNYRTELFLPKADFWTGVGSVFNLGGNYFRRDNSPTGWERDALALENDWRAIGQDLAGLIGMYPLPDPDFKMNLSNYLHELNSDTAKSKDSGQGSQDTKQSVTGDDYHEKIDKVISKLDYDDKSMMIQAFMSVQKSWKGPLPHPQTLKEYNDCFEAGAKTVFDLAKWQSDHRMQIEDRELDQSNQGQHYAFIIAMAFLLVSGFLIWNGNEVAGTILGTVDLIGLVSVFIIGKRRANRQS